MPTMLEQETIVDRIQRGELLGNACRKHLTKLRALKTALMQDLLTGRKRVTALL